MIPTLLKHEAIRTRGLLAVIAGAAVAVVGLGALLVIADWPGLSPLGLVVAIGAIAALAPVVQFALAVDYWRSSYRTTGFLTHALPIRGGTVYAAKAIWAVLMTLAALVLSAALIAVLHSANAVASGQDANPFTALARLLDDLATAVPAWMLVAGPLLVVALYAGWTLQLLLAASVGSEEPLNRRGAGGPVIVFALLYVATQALSLLGLAVIRYGIGASGDGIGVVPINVFDPAAADTAIMPLGFIPGILLLSAFAVWRTARSWNRRVSLV